MANLLSQADGNFTAAATWASVDSTALISTSSSNTNLTTSNQNSAAFTPGAITIDAIALKIDYLNTGTADHSLIMTLRNNTDSVDVVSMTYSVNSIRQTSNMGLQAGWMIFKLDTTYALTAGKAYIIQLRLSATTGKAALYVCTNGTGANWQHMLRQSGTTNTPAAGDDLFICGELAAPSTWTDRTVTMNETATTVYGAGANASMYAGSLCIGDHATLTWGTAESTNYNLKLRGNLFINVGGTMNMGTVATPCPRTSSMTLTFDNYASSKAYGIYVGAPVTAQNSVGEGTLSLQGQSRTSGKNVWKSLLTADITAGATTVNITDDTGWKSGDRVCVSGPTSSKSEVVTLNADAGASSFTVGSGLLAHVATEPYVAIAHLLTRNVVIKSAEAAQFQGQLNAYGVVDADWAEFNYFYVVNFASYSKSMSLEYCSFDGGYSTYVHINIPSGATNFYVRHCNIAAGYSGIQIATPGSTWEVTDLVITPYSTNATGNPFSITGYNSTSPVNDLYVSNFSSGAVTIGTNVANGMNSLTFARWRVYTTATGVNLNTAHASGIRELVFDDMKVLGANYGLRIIGSAGFFYKCTFKNIILSSITGIDLQYPLYECIFENVDLGTHTNGSTCTTGIIVNHGPDNLEQDAKFVNCEIGKSGGSWSGITGYTFAMNNSGQSKRCAVYFKLQNCVINGTSGEYSNATYLMPYSYLAFQRKGDVDDTHERTYFNIGKISYQTVVYHTTSPSMKMEPISASVKLQSGVRYVPVADGVAAKTVHVWMRKNSAYNGNAPRIMLKRADNLGVTADTVVATATLTNNDTWYDISGALPVATDDGVYEVYVDCDGTAGILYLDDWSIA